MHEGLVELERLLARAVELGRHRGAVNVRRLFSSGLLDQDGELERQLALALADVGLRPAWGMEVLPGIISDACFPEASYIIERDGGRWHAIDTDRAADVTREGALVAYGWRVDRIRDADVRSRADAVVAAIRTTRAARIAAGLGRPASWRPVRPGRRVRPPRA
ncbi:MAG: endonuclease domain-containing protein [Actinobacteria bacterium]|nr:endonuclease domain-containing protein [Actinomycetota bacterium]